MYLCRITRGTREADILISVNDGATELANVQFAGIYDALWIALWIAL